MSAASSASILNIDEMRPETRILQEAVADLNYPASYFAHLLQCGVESVECLSQMLSSDHHRVLTDQILIGHLIEINIAGNRITREQSESNGICVFCINDIYTSLNPIVNAQKMLHILIHRGEVDHTVMQRNGICELGIWSQSKSKKRKLSENDLRVVD